MLLEDVGLARDTALPLHVRGKIAAVGGLGPDPRTEHHDLVVAELLARTGDAGVGRVVDVDVLALVLIVVGDVVVRVPVGVDVRVEVQLLGVDAPGGQQPDVWVTGVITPDASGTAAIQVQSYTSP